VSTVDNSELEDRWSHLVKRLPGRLEDLSGPGGGSVQVPLHLAWSGLTTFDLHDDQLILGLYRIVITNGLREDLSTLLNADLLIRQWPRLRVALGRQVRVCWEQHFPELRPVPPWHPASTAATA
jgi:hypothetical protein